MRGCEHETKRETKGEDGGGECERARRAGNSRLCEQARRVGDSQCQRATSAVDGGFVTAESAVVLPVLVMFAMALVWGLLVVAAQIQCVDAARTGARSAARQDPADSVVEVTREAAPRGAKVTVGREGDQVRVVVVAKPPA